MTIFVDSANINEVEKWVKQPFVKGITTNPFLMAKVKPKNRFDHLKSLYILLGKGQLLMVQASGETPDELLEDVRTIHEMLPKAVINIPADKSGFSIAPTLNHDKVEICFTAVFSAAQGILAAFAGGHYVAPYVGRMQDVELDPWSEIEDMQDAFMAHELDSHVLASSLRTPKDVARAFALGCHVTVKPEILEQCLSPTHTDEMVKEFNRVRLV
ncbi:MAG: transaldolase family protein [Candidatus Diapherotrites archaeon]|nr:transaldolase family protein [Candidatus Diapherotrites archaeon]MDZ4256324.1 transaldolase family protein [archaeon]